MTTTARLTGLTGLTGKVALLVMLALMLLAAPAQASHGDLPVAPNPSEEPDPDPTPQVDPAADDLGIELPCQQQHTCDPVPPPPPPPCDDPQDCLAPNPSEPEDNGDEIPVPDRIDTGGGGTASGSYLALTVLAVLVAALAGTTYTLRNRR